ncbi:MAG: hypothetical protein H6706_27075 [Myxococcales bacterium]|nr:hypothetical protein [Myxococcales bacterium]
MAPADFAAALPDALAAVADGDSDGDGFANRAEVEAGTRPADAASRPGVGPAPGCTSANPDWDVCGYDAPYAFRKLHLDVCGASPTFEALTAFRALGPDAQRAALGEALDACLATPFWQGRDGVLWQLGHAKIRPLQAVKSGLGAGPVPLANYDDDYGLFVWTQSGDRDAREVLTADYYVEVRENPTRYRLVTARAGQNAGTNHRAGMLTTRWFAVINTMFTPVNRTAAAQAYRAYLGLDIARSEGLIEPEAPLVDYDDKGVEAEACAVCHRTLDPLTYPFTRYHGITGVSTGAYDRARMTRFGPEEGARIREVPEAGFIFGEPVADLVAWARVAADSEAFARATVADYWRLLVGHDPTDAEAEAFDGLVDRFRGEHAYQVERMLHDLIALEAYGAP